MTPTGGDGQPRTDGQQSPTANLLERILDPVNVRLAWRRVRNNKGAPGVDGVTIEEFPSRFRPEWPEIRQALAEGRYRPSPVRKVTIPSRPKIRWADPSFREFKRRLKRYTSRSWGVSMDHRLGCLRRYMRGWMNYYGTSEYYRPLPGLDSWLRRRVRMCYWSRTE